MTDHIKNLKIQLRQDLADVAERFDSGKKLTKAMEESLFYYIVGFTHGLKSAGEAIPPIIYLNAMSGRLDRFLVKEEAKNE